MKNCPVCKETKSLEDFYNNKAQTNGKSSACKNCTDIINRRGRIGAYGLTQEQFDNLLKEQDGRCAICQRAFTNTLLPSIDHDHSCCPSKKQGDRPQTLCGRCIRGLLCKSCNTGLGMFNDDFERLRSAILIFKHGILEDILLKMRV